MDRDLIKFIQHDIVTRHYASKLLARYFSAWKFSLQKYHLQLPTNGSLVNAGFRWMCKSLSTSQTEHLFPFYAAIENDGEGSAFFISRLRSYMIDKLEVPVCNLPLLVHAIAMFDAHQLKQCFQGWKIYYIRCFRLDKFAETNRKKESLFKWMRRTRRKQFIESSYRHVYTKCRKKKLKILLLKWKLVYDVNHCYYKIILPNRTHHCIQRLHTWQIAKQFQRLTCNNGVEFHWNKRVLRSCMLWIQKLSKLSSSIIDLNDIKTNNDMEGSRRSTNIMHRVKTSALHQWLVQRVQDNWIESQMLYNIYIIAYGTRSKWFRRHRFINYITRSYRGSTNYNNIIGTLSPHDSYSNIYRNSNNNVDDGYGSDASNSYNNRSSDDDSNRIGTNRLYSYRKYQQFEKHDEQQLQEQQSPSYPAAEYFQLPTPIKPMDAHVSFNINPDYRTKFIESPNQHQNNNNNNNNSRKYSSSSPAFHNYVATNSNDSGLNMRLFDDYPTSPLLSPLKPRHPQQLHHHQGLTTTILTTNNHYHHHDIVDSGSSSCCNDSSTSILDLTYNRKSRLGQGVLLISASWYKYYRNIASIFRIWMHRVPQMKLDCEHHVSLYFPISRQYVLQALIARSSKVEEKEDDRDLRNSNSRRSASKYRSKYNNNSRGILKKSTSSSVTTISPIKIANNSGNSNIFNNMAKRRSKGQYRYNLSSYYSALGYGNTTTHNNTTTAATSDRNSSPKSHKKLHVSSTVRNSNNHPTYTNSIIDNDLSNNNSGGSKLSYTIYNTTVAGDSYSHTAATTIPNNSNSIGGVVSTYNLGYNYRCYKHLRAAVHRWSIRCRRCVYLRTRSDYLKQTNLALRQACAFGAWLIAAARHQHLAQLANRITCKRFHTEIWIAFFGWRRQYERSVLVKNNQIETIKRRNAEIAAYVESQHKKRVVRSKAAVLKDWCGMMRNRMRARAVSDLWFRFAGAKSLRIAFFDWRMMPVYDAMLIRIVRRWRGYQVRYITHARKYAILNQFRVFIAKYMPIRKLASRRSVFHILSINRELALRKYHQSMLRIVRKRGLYILYSYVYSRMQRHRRMLRMAEKQHCLYQLALAWQKLEYHRVRKGFIHSMVLKEKKRYYRRFLLQLCRDCYTNKRCRSVQRRYILQTIQKSFQRLVHYTQSQQMQYQATRLCQQYQLYQSLFRLLHNSRKRLRMKVWMRRKLYAHAKKMIRFWFAYSTHYSNIHKQAFRHHNWYRKSLWFQWWRTHARKQANSTRRRAIRTARHLPKNRCQASYNITSTSNNNNNVSCNNQTSNNFSEKDHLINAPKRIKYVAKLVRGIVSSILRKFLRQFAQYAIYQRRNYRMMRYIDRKLDSAQVRTAFYVLHAAWLRGIKRKKFASQRHKISSLKPSGGGGGGSGKEYYSRNNNNSSSSSSSSSRSSYHHHGSSSGGSGGYNNSYSTNSSYRNKSSSIGTMNTPVSLDNMNKDRKNIINKTAKQGSRLDMNYSSKYGATLKNSNNNSSSSNSSNYNGSNKNQQNGNKKDKNYMSNEDDNGNRSSDDSCCYSSNSIHIGRKIAAHLFATTLTVNKKIGNKNNSSANMTIHQPRLYAFSGLGVIKLSIKRRLSLTHAELLVKLRHNIAHDWEYNSIHAGFRLWLQYCRYNSRNNRTLHRITHVVLHSKLHTILQRWRVYANIHHQSRNAVYQEQRKLQEMRLRCGWHALRVLCRRHSRQLRSLVHHIQRQRLASMKKVFVIMYTNCYYQRYTLKLYCVQRLRVQVKIFMRLLRYHAWKRFRGPANDLIVFNKMQCKRKAIAYRRYRALHVLRRYRLAILRVAARHRILRQGIRCFRYWRKYATLKRRLATIIRRMYMKPSLLLWWRTAADTIKYRAATYNIMHRIIVNYKQRSLDNWRQLASIRSRVRRRGELIAMHSRKRHKKVILYHWMLCVDHRVSFAKYNKTVDLCRTNILKRCMFHWHKSALLCQLSAYKSMKRSLLKWLHRSDHCHQQHMLYSRSEAFYDAYLTQTYLYQWYQRIVRKSYIFRKYRNALRSRALRSYLIYFRRWKRRMYILYQKAGRQKLLHYSAVEAETVMTNILPTTTTIMMIPTTVGKDNNNITRRHDRILQQQQLEQQLLSSSSSSNSVLSPSSSSLSPLHLNHHRSLLPLQHQHKVYQQKQQQHQNKKEKTASQQEKLLHQHQLKRYMKRWHSVAKHKARNNKCKIKRNILTHWHSYRFQQHYARLAFTSRLQSFRHRQLLTFGWMALVSNSQTLRMQRMLVNYVKMVNKSKTWHAWHRLYQQQRMEKHSIQILITAVYRCAMYSIFMTWKLKSNKCFRQLGHSILQQHAMIRWRRVMIVQSHWRLRLLGKMMTAWISRVRDIDAVMHTQLRIRRKLWRVTIRRMRDDILKLTVAFHIWLRHHNHSSNSDHDHMRLSQFYLYKYLLSTTATTNSNTATSRIINSSNSNNRQQLQEIPSPMKLLYQQLGTSYAGRFLTNAHINMSKNGKNSTSLLQQQSQQRLQVIQAHLEKRFVHAAASLRSRTNHMKGNMNQHQSKKEVVKIVSASAYGGYHVLVTNSHHKESSSNSSNDGDMIYNEESRMNIHSHHHSNYDIVNALDSNDSGIDNNSARKYALLGSALPDSHHNSSTTNISNTPYKLFHHSVFDSPSATTTTFPSTGTYVNNTPYNNILSLATTAAAGVTDNDSQLENFTLDGHNVNSSSNIDNKSINNVDGSSNNGTFNRKKIITNIAANKPPWQLLQGNKSISMKNEYNKKHSNNDGNDENVSDHTYNNESKTEMSSHLNELGNRMMYNEISTATATVSGGGRNRSSSNSLLLLVHARHQLHNIAFTPQQQLPHNHLQQHKLMPTQSIMKYARIPTTVGSRNSMYSTNTVVAPNMQVNELM